MTARFSRREPRGSVTGWTPILVAAAGLLALGASAHLSHAQRGFGVRQSPPPVFTNPTKISNPYLPLSSLNLDILEGSEEGKKFRIERKTVMGATKLFTINGQTVNALVMEDRETLDGQLKEITLDYFAQSDDGTVYYLGEDVDVYENGRVVSHEGAWLYGVQTKTLGVIMPANPKVGDKWQLEEVPGITVESDRALSASETVTVPAGTYTNCLRVEEKNSDGGTDYKYYAPGVGVVKEVSGDGEANLISHR